MNEQSKYVWLNIATGKFSNSWDSKTHEQSFTEDLLKINGKENWKLIKFQCLNDENFEFYNLMQITTAKL